MLTISDPVQRWDRLFDQASFPAAAMDAFRQGDVITLEFDLPGVDPSTIDLQLERGELRLSAQRRSTLPEGARYLIRERTETGISRRIVLGDVLDVENVDAEYNDGVLTIRVPLHEHAKARRVEVRHDTVRPDDRAALAIEGS